MDPETGACMDPAWRRRQTSLSRPRADHGADGWHRLQLLGPGAGALCLGATLARQRPSSRCPNAGDAIHLSGPKTHVAGASIAGIPGVIIGHTEGVAWGLTLSMLDDQDLFILSLDDSGGRELVDGRWQPLRTVTENIEVRWQPAPVLVKIRLA